ITFSEAVTMTGMGIGLIAQAGHDIKVAAPITTSGGFVHLEADSPLSPMGAADGMGSVTVMSKVATTGGSMPAGADITLIGAGFTISADVDAGTGGNIAVARSQNGMPFVLGTGGQLVSGALGHLKTVDGMVTLGRASTATLDPLTAESIQWNGTDTSLS